MTFNICFLNSIICTSTFNTIIVKIKEFEETFKRTGAFEKGLLLVLRVIPLYCMWFQCWDAGVWMFKEMWKRSDYDVLNIYSYPAKFMRNDISKVNLILCLFFYGPLYYLTHFIMIEIIFYPLCFFAFVFMLIMIFSQR